MSHPLLKSGLDALSQAGSDTAARGVLQGHRRELISNPEIGAELAAVVAVAREAQDISAELMALEVLIEEARMDRENEGAFGAAFLSALDDAIARLAGKGEITEAGIFLLGRCFVRAGLEAPGHLRQSGAAEARDYPATPGDLPDLDELLAQLKRSLSTVLDELEQAADVSLPLQWCLRDVKCDHVLFAGERVSGLIDFGAAAVDSVAGDVARLVGSLVGDAREDWPPALEAYHACRQLSPDERRAIHCFDRGGTLAAAANWLRWLFVEERSISQAEAVQAQLVGLCDRLRAL